MTRVLAKRSNLELLFAEQVRGARLPVPERDYRFHPKRKWALDFAWTHEVMAERQSYMERDDAPIAIEIEGGSWVAGRHVQGQGFEEDCEKYAEALIAGWRVLRVTGDMVLDGRAIALTRRLFRA